MNSISPASKVLFCSLSSTAEFLSGVGAEAVTDSSREIVGGVGGVLPLAISAGLITL